MNKRELIQAVEKAKNQTKCEATRVVNKLLGGRVVTKPGNPLSFEADKNVRDAVDE
jgi:hypothetical protein